MLTTMTIDHGLGTRPAHALATGVPRITPIHGRVDKRHSDLSFNIDTGGRPSYRVLIARSRELFAPEQAGARNASNFYDSQAEGLQHDDGPPCFYLVPRSVLHAMLPAGELFYTLIAYEDREGTRAVYAQAPETLTRSAPAVAIASDLIGSLALMFGTPVTQLLKVGASLAFGLADEAIGEDLGADVPAAIGLADDEGWGGGDEGVDGAAAYANAYGEDDGGYLAEEPLDHAAGALGSYDSHGAYGAYGADGGEDYDDGYRGDHESAQSYAADDDARAPMMEGAESAAAFDDGARADAGVDDIWGGAEQTSAAHALEDDYDDGFGVSPARSYEEQGEDVDAAAGSYGAEHDVSPYGGRAQAHGHDDDRGAVHAFDAPTRQPVPEMLPDEDADGAHAAQAGQYDEDEVDVEPPPAQAHAASYGADYGDEDYSDSYAAAGGGAAPNVATPPAAARVPFDIEACKAILARIAPFESGRDGFARTIEDGEFAGRFGANHPAHRRFHLGLTFGAFPFVQEQGTLGQLLALMRERDRATFDASFPEADQLLAVTNAADGPRAWESPDGLSARLRPVGGQPLWQEPWLARFKRAATHPPFQGAQNELAARLYVQPVLQVAQQIGLDSEQGLTLLIDRAVQMGAPAALAWVLECATPIETPALRQQALASLGKADLSAFQSDARLPVTGVLDVATHAALIAALRAHPHSPTPVLGGNEIVAAMLRHAQGLPWAERMARLREATSATRLFQL